MNRKPLVSLIITAIFCINLVSMMGCAGLINTAQQILCNPTAEQQATAAAVKNFLSSAAPFAAVVGIAITPAQAQAVFSAIQGGLCVGATDLQLALSWFQAVTAPAQTAKLKAAMAPIPDVTPLWNMIPGK